MSSSRFRELPPELTRLLQGWSRGDQESLEELLPLVYDELRRIARGQLAGERPGHTLSPTALVHEAYLRFSDKGMPRWRNRSQFFAIAATTIRRILVEHARSRGAAKRGHGMPNLPLIEVGDLRIERPEELIALDDSLEALAGSDPRKAQVVDLRFFGGLSVDETAEAVGCSRATIIREWRMAKAWLYHQLSQDASSRKGTAAAEGS